MLLQINQHLLFSYEVQSKRDWNNSICNGSFEGQDVTIVSIDAVHMFDVLV